jgi:hypothetical protein
VTTKVRLGPSEIPMISAFGPICTILFIYLCSVDISFTCDVL